MAPWLKAGLIGAAVLVVLDLLGLIPIVCLVTYCLSFLVYLGIGGLAAHYLPPRRDAGQAAGQGALAAAFAGLVGGLLNAVLMTVQLAAVGSEQVLSLLPPDLLEQWQAMGLDPSVLESFAGPQGGAVTGGLCCAFGLLVGAALGAIGGGIYAGARPE